MFVFFILCASTSAFLSLPTQTSNKGQLAGTFFLVLRDFGWFPKRGELPRWLSSRESTYQRRRRRRLRFKNLGWDDPQRRKWQPTSVFLAGKFHGQRSLAACSPWGCKESDTAERLRIHPGQKETENMNFKLKPSSKYSRFPLLPKNLLLNLHESVASFTQEFSSNSASWWKWKWRVKKLT